MSEYEDRPSPPPGGIPLDLAFGRKQLTSIFDGRVALDPAGQRIAYQVHTPPDASALGGARFLPSGVPQNVLGQRIHLTTVTGEQPVPIGPAGANSWHASWSPDGRMLAFYCDEVGYPQLWLHEIATGQSRPVADVAVKAKLWIGDEPQWLPGGDAVVVPLATLDTAADAEKPTASGEAGPKVRVLRSRDDADETGEPGSAVELNDHFMRENNAAIAAIDLRDGTVRVLAPADSTPPPSVVQVSPSGRWISYLSVFLQDEKTSSPTAESFHDLAVVQTAGGPVRVIDRQIAKSAFPPGYYLEGYRWHPTEDRLVWLKNGQLWTADLDEEPGTPRQLASG
ncbi:MAG: TolB family protein, partial [Streptosporangiales bacterium]